MLRMLRIFSKNYQLYLDPVYQFDARVPPSALINELNPQRSTNQLKHFIKIIKKPTKNCMKLLRMLSVLHLLLIYTNDSYNIVASLLPIEHHCTDQWLVKNVIEPYTQFIQKVCSSRQLYCRTKQPYSNENTFEKLFYLINLLFQLFKPVKKMSMLGRYYKDCNDVITCTFIDVIAVQAQKTYTHFKNILTQMLNQPKKYIDTKAHQELMKSILDDSLIQINQQMKKLFLDKYFYPYGKGIGVKLFRTEDQTQSCSKIIKGILDNHQQTARKQQQQQLELNLFPQQGTFNAKFYQQSLMQTFIKSGGDYLFEEAIAEEQELDIPSPQNYIDKQTHNHTNTYQNYKKTIEHENE